MIDTAVPVAFLGFLLILNGAPVGFLISQVWFRFFIWGDVYGREGNVRPDIQYIVDHFEQLQHIDPNHVKNFRRRFRYLEPLWWKMNDDQVIRLVRTIVADYIHNSQAEDDELTAYSKRRWDLINTMGCVIMAISLAFLFGLPKLATLLAHIQQGYLMATEKWVLILFSIMLPLVSVIHGARRKVVEEHAVVSYLLIQDRLRRVGYEPVLWLINSLIGY
jgi:hypothetical protein